MCVVVIAGRDVDPSAAAEGAHHASDEEQRREGRGREFGVSLEVGEEEDDEARACGGAESRVGDGGAWKRSGDVPELRAMRIWKMLRSGYQSPILRAAFGTRSTCRDVDVNPTKRAFTGGSGGGTHVADTLGNHSWGQPATPFLTILRKWRVKPRTRALAKAARERTVCARARDAARRLNIAGYRAGSSALPGGIFSGRPSASLGRRWLSPLNSEYRWFYNRNGQQEGENDGVGWLLYI